MIRALTSHELATPEFAHLLWLAVEVGDDELARIMRDELPTLTLLGVIADERVVAFVAFNATTDPAVIEYIAVGEEAQGRGLGSALVTAVREAADGAAVYAQTDDDAVEFYRSIGFAITDGDPDPRWPDRPRYDCVLVSDCNQEP